MSGMFPGYEPVEDYEYDEGGMRYTGDSFYSFYSFPSGNGNAVTLSPRGSLNNGGSPKEMTAKWRRWTAKRGEFGEYEPKDGAEGAKWLGLPRFRGDGEYFVRSFAKTNGHFTYGRIISDALCYSLSIGGSTLTPVFSSINGYVYWSGEAAVWR